MTLPKAVQDERPEPLANRAYRYHREHVGRRCRCVGRGAYPCPACQREIVAVLDVLDAVVRDTIDVTTRAWARQVGR
jgi:hypothetical protein